MTGPGQEPEPGPEGLVEEICRFAKCPDCGSTRRMMAELGKEMVEKGLLTEGMDVGLDEIGGPIIDPMKASQMLANSIRPGMFALRDVCIGCGRTVTVKIMRKPVGVTVGMIAGPGQLGQSGTN